MDYISIDYDVDNSRHFPCSRTHLQMNSQTQLTTPSRANKYLNVHNVWLSVSILT